MSNDNYGMRIRNHTIVPSKWVGKTVRMILMTAVMISLFTSAAILAQNGNGNVAFAKKAATTATKDTGTAAKTTHTVDTGTSKKPSKDTSGSGSTSSSSSTSTSNPNDNTKTTGSDNGAGGATTAGTSGTVDNAKRILPPDYIPRPGQPDKICNAGQHRNSDGVCVKNGPVDPICAMNKKFCPDNPNRPCIISGIGKNTGCNCPRNAACPKPMPRPCTISSGGKVSTASCHCQTIAKCPPQPKPKPNPNPATTGDPFNDSGCAKGRHFVIALGCVRNKITPQEAFGLGCKMAVTMDPTKKIMSELADSSTTRRNLLRAIT